MMSDERAKSGVSEGSPKRRAMSGEARKNAKVIPPMRKN